MQAVKQATLSIHDREELMKAAFNDVKKFPMAKIEEIRQQQYSAVMVSTSQQFEGGGYTPMTSDAVCSAQLSLSGMALAQTITLCHGSRH